jgi:tellurite resistance protein
MTSTVDSSPATWIDYTPPGLFASVMGIAGLGLAWRKAHEVIGVQQFIGEIILLVAAAVFVVVATLYGIKAIRGSAQFKSDMVHPVRANFVPAATIGILLLSTAVIPYNRIAGELLWIVGTAGHLFLAIRIIRRWMGEPYEINTVNASWFIPVVGNIIVPISGMRLGYVETSWMLFSFGLIFWLLLFTIVLYRKLFHDPIPAKLMPTFAILVAPPAIGFVSYMALNGGQIDALARILYYVALLLAAIVVSLFPKLVKIPFGLPWWAYTFPMDALAIASLIYAGATRASGVEMVASVALALATMINIWVAYKTVRAIQAGHVFVPE